MVNIASHSRLLWVALTAALADSRAAEPLIERLDPPRRAAVVMALLAIAIVGLFLVTLAMLGGHWARRLARRQHPPSDRHKNIENERMRSALQPILPTGTAGETTVTRPASNDTVTGR
jgi:predicted PurR-regulated permease PerM